MTHEAAGPGLAEVDLDRIKARLRHAMDFREAYDFPAKRLSQADYDIYLLITEVERLHSALRAATAPQDGWQPIETAPKDGTLIWLIEDGKPLGLLVAHHVSGFWVPDARYQSGGYWAAVDSANVLHPSHWMPLPAAPHVAQEGQS